MRRATFRMVAAGDGAPPSPTGYCYYLVVHAVGTVLLLLTLVAAVWQFMDWVVTPSECLVSSSRPSAPSSGAGAAARVIATAPAPTVHDAARTQLASDSGDCPCESSARTFRMLRDSAGPRLARDAGTSEKHSPK
jgi:hypothetical protein